MTIELPLWLYGPDGKERLVKDLDTLAALLKEGWADTPAAFLPGYVPKATLAASAAAKAPVLVVAQFPGYRYNKDGDAKLVRSQEEADALDPTQWKDTPDPSAFVAPPAPPAPPALTDAERAKALHTTHADDVIAMIGTITDPALLAVTRERETRNTRRAGGRPSVLAAIDARIAALTPAPVVEDAPAPVPTFDPDIEAGITVP